MTRDFGFQGLILRTAPLIVCYDNPGVLKTFSIPDPHEIFLCGCYCVFLIMTIISLKLNQECEIITGNQTIIWNSIKKKQNQQENNNNTIVNTTTIDQQRHQWQRRRQRQRHMFIPWNKTKTSIAWFFKWNFKEVLHFNLAFNGRYRA